MANMSMNTLTISGDKDQLLGLYKEIIKRDYACEVLLPCWPDDCFDVWGTEAEDSVSSCTMIEKNDIVKLEIYFATLRDAPVELCRNLSLLEPDFKIELLYLEDCHNFVGIWTSDGIDKSWIDFYNNDYSEDEDFVRVYDFFDLAEYVE